MTLASYHRAGRGEDALVLLPGAQMRGQELLDHGFFEAADARACTADLLVVEIDLAGLRAAQAAEYLTEQVLRPARARYRRLWLGGISLGGHTALLLTADAAVPVDGLCLLAPYPGTRLTTGRIERAGGLDAWQPAPTDLADPECRVWHWLRSPPADLPVFLGYGASDRFADGMRAMVQRMPNARVQVLPGGHDWPVWQSLWAHFLDSGACVLQGA